MNNIKPLIHESRMHGSDPTGDVQRGCRSWQHYPAAAKVHRVPSNLTTRLRQLEQNWGLICLFARISVYVSRLRA